MASIAIGYNENNVIVGLSNMFGLLIMNSSTGLVKYSGISSASETYDVIPLLGVSMDSNDNPVVIYTTTTNSVVIHKFSVDLRNTIWK